MHILKKQYVRHLYSQQQIHTKSGLIPVHLLFFRNDYDHKASQLTIEYLLESFHQSYLY